MINHSKIRSIVEQKLNKILIAIRYDSDDTERELYMYNNDLRLASRYLVNWDYEIQIKYLVYGYFRFYVKMDRYIPEDIKLLCIVSCDCIIV